MPMPRTAAGRLGATGLRTARLVVPVVRRHWLLALLLVAGLVLRILAQIAYRPALFYVDSIKYLFGAYAGNDPPGYGLLLKPFLAVANLDMVATVQHLLGLAMAAALYMLLLRKGAPRWLAALAAAPVLLDGYQLQLEQTIMPSVPFEALLVAGLVVLLWQPRPRAWMIAAAGLLLGATATIWQPGEILIVPALVYVALMSAGWRRTLRNTGLVCVAFAAPVLLVSFRNYLVIKHFALAPYASSTIYGRMAADADCQTLKLPSYEQGLCPPRQLAASLGIDGLDHSPRSPIRTYAPPPGAARRSYATDFSLRVAKQQPLRVVGGILGDAMKLFAVDRVTMPGDTHISRWQFQTHFPAYPPYVLAGGGRLKFAMLDKNGQPVVLGSGQQLGGGDPVVVKPLAAILRGYQLHGGYTPGPLLLIGVLGGLAGSAFLFRRRGRMSAGDRDAARACCFVLASGVVVLLVADTFEFSWRYQLPAVVTLPPAGALGLLVIARYLRGLRGSRAAGGRLVTSAGTVPEAAVPQTVPGSPNGETAANGHAAPNGKTVPNGYTPPSGETVPDGEAAPDGEGVDSRLDQAGSAGPAR